MGPINPSLSSSVEGIDREGGTYVYMYTFRRLAISALVGWCDGPAASLAQRVAAIVNCFILWAQEFGLKNKTLSLNLSVWTIRSRLSPWAQTVLSCITIKRSLESHTFNSFLPLVQTKLQTKGDQSSHWRALRLCRYFNQVFCVKHSCRVWYFDTGRVTDDIKRRFVCQSKRGGQDGHQTLCRLSGAKGCDEQIRQF